MSVAAAVLTGILLSILRVFTYNISHMIKIPGIKSGDFFVQKNEKQSSWIFLKIAIKIKSTDKLVTELNQN